MMRFFYNLGIEFYSFGVLLASVFSEKAKKRVAGYRRTKKKLQAISKDKKRLWVHCASLGEFEQGRPIIEEFQKNPDWEVFVSFFSPSGYEIVKKKGLVENIFYLLPDRPKHAKQTIEILDPDLVLFVKYEFWANHIFEIKKKEVPLFCVSGLFRSGQPYFKYNFFRNILESFDYIFVQNEESNRLLNSIGLNQVQVTGDTRFDRVAEGVENSNSVKVVEDFLRGEKAFVIGSSWPDDEKYIFQLVNNPNFNQKCIIAPHEIGENHLNSLEKGFHKKTIRYSLCENYKFSDEQILVIDNIGMLSNLYRYGSMAYIGGAFHGSLHNILEPAAFGLPVVFGPKFDKFPEGARFIEDGIGKSISNVEELKSAYAYFSSEKEIHAKVLDFIQENIGASNRILTHIKSYDL